MDPKAMFNIGYGLYILTAKDAGKDNGCVINTFSQVTATPNRVMLAVNKSNYTHDLVLSSGVFTVSVLTTSAPFSIFQHFGFQSGKDVDKFKDFEAVERGENGLLHLTEYCNSFISGKVISSVRTRPSSS